LLPLDLRRFAVSELAIPPLTTMRPDQLLERLAEEYVYAQLCEAATHAYEAENEARMRDDGGANQHQCQARGVDFP
jgi:F-type H+-transporting ATPase subunit gamma